MNRDELVAEIAEHRAAVERFETKIVERQADIARVSSLLEIYDAAYEYGKRAAEAPAFETVETREELDRLPYETVVREIHGVEREIPYVWERLAGTRWAHPYRTITRDQPVLPVIILFDPREDNPS